MLREQTLKVEILCKGQAYSLLVPLFISAFRIAQDLAMAMEAVATEVGKIEPG